MGFFHSPLECICEFGPLIEFITFFLLFQCKVKMCNFTVVKYVGLKSYLNLPFVLLKQDLRSVSMIIFGKM